ncbi:heart and neural crest derivatives expressed [Trichuris trichiura]|uniref:Heart and neural crest derivatives expressed n=1 Tax=Trichuris trichiura TaxID=36087 RepID=A0A077ZGT4_TRITR|nr:heart and neural crest derivatives expressed [Trichuris trichiura]
MDLQAAPWWRMQQPYTYHDQATMFSDDSSSDTFATNASNGQQVKSFVSKRSEQGIWPADTSFELSGEEASHSCSWQITKPILDKRYIDFTQLGEAHAVSNPLVAYPFETEWKMDKIAESKRLASDSDTQNRLKIRNREKRRCQAMRCAFEELRHHIPFVPLDKGVPKITTLRLAIQYIVHLKRTLSSDEACTSMRKFSDVVLEEVHRKNRYASSV